MGRRRGGGEEERGVERKGNEWRGRGGGRGRQEREEGKGRGWEEKGEGKGRGRRGGGGEEGDGHGEGKEREEGQGRESERGRGGRGREGKSKVGWLAYTFVFRPHIHSSFSILSSRTFKGLSAIFLLHGVRGKVGLHQKEGAVKGGKTKVIHSFWGPVIHHAPPAGTYEESGVSLKREKSISKGKSVFILHL